ncbi:hypothetical protein Agub_g1078 [Astrephomene gubernaculifera]|uniref:Glycosyltransferase family 92 protein n=1 Tax=Astrephomene gubernaculifera TaxID=47775 RepID=A0AAD3DFV8_9CHLO|nr:hypothetical protein Agub_g1078 [Astrephomene gubernaculifera]
MQTSAPMCEMRQRRGLLLLLSFWVAVAVMADKTEYQTLKSAQTDYHPSTPVDRLGVRMISPVYATIPVGDKEITVALTVWLRRVGATKGPFDMPHQAKDSIRMLVWAEKPDNLHNRAFGHMILPFNHSTWRPNLLLEAAEPGPVLQVLPDKGQQPVPPKMESALRPYSLRVDLPAGVGDCFKLIETSYPKHKFPICLPPAAEDGVCSELAPPTRHNASAPALYLTIAPVRQQDVVSSTSRQCAVDPTSIRDWQQYYARWAVRLRHYVEYHLAAGAAGLLLYADELTRRYLTATPDISPFLKAKQLRLVEWDLPERSHEDDDGLGRPLGYNYDQALFAGHAWLGLSACGTNLMLLVTDLDEYLYSPRPHVRWPAPLTSCMGRPGADRTAATATSPAISDYRLLRYEVVAGDLGQDEEAEVWATKQDSSNSSSGSSSSGVSPSHPLAHYTLIYKQPLSKMHGKVMALPAADVVLFFVHEGHALYGSTHVVDSQCLVLLHVTNFFCARRKSVNPDTLQEFRHWMFYRDEAATSVQPA